MYKKSVEWIWAPEIKNRIVHLIKNVDLHYLDTSRIFCFRSKNSKTMALARIWGFSRIWQLALREKPAYIIEVISEKFDKLETIDKDKVLLHEIVHIPQNFSGALLAHRKSGKGNFSDRLKKLIHKYSLEK